MKEFFIENWRFIVEIVISIIVLLVTLFKKRVNVKVSSDAYSEVLEFIPVWIREAEDEYGSGHGHEKFNYVFRASLSYICEKMDISIDWLPAALIANIRLYIEDVLSTPTKKEVSNNEKR